MRVDSFRFRPPPFELPDELRWVLGRAFGPLPDRPVPVERPELVLRWARDLVLAERIASRVPRRDVESELPSDAVQVLWRSRDALAARGLLLRELLGQVAGCAVEIGAPVIGLKGIALLESGISSWGERPLLDLDLLVDAREAPRLFEALTAAGLEQVGRGERQHLPPLADRRLGQVELHLHLPGVVVAGGRPAASEALRRANLVRPYERFEGFELPVPDLLAAHAYAHCLDQHGFSPTACPITRLIADLVDLDGCFDETVTAGWLAPSVSAREQAAAIALRTALCAGEPSEAGDDGLALLRHTVAAITSERYRNRQRLRAALRALWRRRWSKFHSEVSRRVAALRRLE